MGCLFSKAEEATQRALGAKYAVGPDSAPASPIKPSGGAASSGSSARSNVVNAPLVPAKAKLDPKDFIFLERKGEKLVKPPGSAAGQQFCIDACEDCEIYVLDHCDSLTIDDCKRCTIVVGPTSGSVFIRDCESCTCVFMCRQYRSRDCVDCDTHLHVTTRPIIETSANMRFGCWDFHYPALEAQMADAGISAYQNFWSHVFNFNPGSATWSLMPPGEHSIDALSPLPPHPALDGVADALAGGKPPPVCHRTWGEREDPGGGPAAGETESCLVLIPEAREASAGAIVAGVTDGADGNPRLWRTNKAQVSAAWARPFLEECGFAGNAASVAAELAVGKCVGLEFAGDDAVARATKAVAGAPFPILTDANRYAEWRYMGVEG